MLSRTVGGDPLPPSGIVYAQRCKTGPFQLPLLVDAAEAEKWFPALSLESLHRALCAIYPIVWEALDVRLALAFLTS